MPLFWANIFPPILQLKPAPPITTAKLKRKGPLFWSDSLDLLLNRSFLYELVLLLNILSYYFMSFWANRFMFQPIAKYINLILLSQTNPSDAVEVLKTVMITFWGKLIKSFYNFTLLWYLTLLKSILQMMVFQKRSF